MHVNALTDFRRTKDQLPRHIHSNEVECGDKSLCQAEVRELLYEVMACGRKNFLYLLLRQRIQEIFPAAMELYHLTDFKKARQRLFFLRKLKQARLPQRLLINFYSRTMESTLTSWARVWCASCTAAERHLPSGRRIRTIKSTTNRLRTSFYLRAVASISPTMNIHPQKLQQ